MTLKILQFGATGQLAREVIRAAPTAQVSVQALSRAEADVTDRDAVLGAIAATDADLVLNATAFSDVDGAESRQTAAFAVNGAAPGFMAQACAERGLPLIHVSTDSVFDGEKDGPYQEADPAHPISVYGASKLAGEVAVLERAPRSAVVRTSWLFSALGRNFLQIMLGLKGRPQVQVVADQHARPTASADLARFLLAAAPRWVDAREGDEAWGVTHFANAGAATRLEMARAIFGIAGGPAPELVPTTTAAFNAIAARPVNAELDCARLEAVFGVSPRPWREALAEVMADLRETAA
ncbi:MAG TPA: dTDP-4-dehydrorhamnose reductase [Phenylobacterium sp.]|nr:dTDP-4-dehydrorhamnose reductase [Phenylobacterium sp.]